MTLCGVRAPGMVDGGAGLSVLVLEGFLLLEVPAAPDAGADPEAAEADDEGDEHGDPLPVVGEPV